MSPTCALRWHTITGWDAITGTDGDVEICGQPATWQATYTHEHTTTELPVCTGCHDFLAAHAGDTTTTIKWSPL